MVIGLGKSGEIALRHWLGKLAQDPAGPQDGLRAMHISREPVAPFPNHIAQTRILHLEEPQTVVPSAGLIPDGQRAAASLRFHQVENYSKFEDWLGDSLLDLRSEVQVFVVGSLAEAEIGVLGDVLQILRTLPESQAKGGSPYTNILALLSAAAASGEALPPEEIYAAERELGRFTFNGPHVMESSLGLQPIVRSALLDHLFVLEDYSAVLRGSLGGAPFDLGIGEALAEAVLTLTHPSSVPLWENLAKELRQDAGQLRSRFHRIFVHSLGIATLYVPLAEIQTYVAVRLSQAAVYGEREDAAEGLLAERQSNPDLQVSARLLGQRWLLNGPCNHPVFGWMLGISGPADLESIPLLSPEFESAFRTQLSHGLVGFLNDPAGSNLELGRAGLESLRDWLNQLDKWFKTSLVHHPEAVERLSFEGLIHGCRETLQGLIASISLWEQALLPPLDSERDSSVGSVAARSNYRRQLSSSALDVPRRQAAAGPKNNLYVYLQTARQNATEELKGQARGQVYRPVTADESGGVTEVDRYYGDTIRPELSQHALKDSNSASARVRERLEWWIDLVPGRQPQLLLLCWPADYQTVPGSDPPQAARFTSANIGALAETLLEVSRSQVRGSASDLTRSWFDRRATQMVDFLRRANDAYLNFDMNAVASLPNAAARRSYMIARDPVVSGKYARDVLADIPRHELNELGGSEPSRLTALTFRLNVPLDAVRAVPDLYTEYQNKASGRLHLYCQETTAVGYEKQIWLLERRPVLFPPDLTLVLADPQLVTLFCQALIAGLVQVRADKDRQSSQWVMSAVSREYARLPLAPADEDGLWNAFRRFVLELPNDPEVDLNPTNHFYRGRRKEYLAQLTASIKAKMAQHPYKSARERFRKTIVSEWEKKGENDLRAESFAWLLRAEMDEPAWKGW